MDPKDLRKQLEETVNPVVDQRLEGKTPTAAPKAAPATPPATPPAPQVPQTPAAVAPSAPAAGAPTQSEGKVVGIIGTAGRPDRATKKKPALTKEIFDSWVERAAKMIPSDATVVSGGAAWADHVAVRLYLDGKVKGLILELPAELVSGPAFADHEYQFSLGGYDTPSQKAAWTADKLHSEFSKAMGVDTRAEIQQAIEKGAMDGSVVVSFEPRDSDDPFKNRNTKVAQQAKDGLLAFTPVGQDGGPVDGGTRDTWEKHAKIYPAGKRVAPKDPAIVKAFEGITLQEYRAPRQQTAMPTDMPEFEYDLATEVPTEGATSPVSPEGGLPVPPQGETPVSVAPRAISGESGGAGDLYYITYEKVPAPKGRVPNIPMSFSYEEDKAWVGERLGKTVDEIVEGRRTSTLRSVREFDNAASQGRGYEKGKTYKAGDGVYVRIKSISRFNPKNLTRDQWAKISDTERWSVDYLVRKYGSPQAAEESPDVLMSRETPESLGFEDEAGRQKNQEMIDAAKARLSTGAAPEKMTTAATPDQGLEALLAETAGLGQAGQVEEQGTTGRRTGISEETRINVQQQGKKEDTRPSVRRAKRAQDKARLIDFMTQPHSGADRIYSMYVDRVIGDTETVGRLRALDSVADPVAKNRGRQAVRSDFLHEMFNYLQATTPRVEAERETFREILRSMGLLPDAERLGFETKIQNFKDPFGPPSFAAKGGKVTPDLAEKNNAERDRIAARQVGDIIKKLHRAGRLGVLNHPDYAQFIKWAFDTVLAYDEELTQGIREEFNPTRERTFVSSITGLDEKDLDVRDTEVLDALIAEITGNPDATVPGEFFDDLRKGIKVDGWDADPRTSGVALTLADLINMRKRGQRRYALDRLGLIDPRWQEVDALGLDIPVFSNVNHPTGASAAAISFNISTDTTSGLQSPESMQRNIGAEIDATRALKKYLKTRLTNHPDLPGIFGTWGAKSAEEAAALANGEAPRSELGILLQEQDSSPTIKVNRTIPYTTDYNQVEAIRQRVMSELPTEKLVMVLIGKGVRVEGAIVLPDGSMFDVSERFVIMEQGDPRIKQLLAKIDGEVSVSMPFSIGEAVRYPEGSVLPDEFDSFRFDVDPVVYPAVRHSIPLRTPPSKQYPFGWAPKGVYYPANFDDANDYNIISGRTVRSFDKSSPAPDPDVISTMIMPTGPGGGTYPYIGQFIDDYQFGNLIDEDPQLYAEIGRPELGEPRAGEISSGFETTRRIQEEQEAGVSYQDSTKIGAEAEANMGLLEESLMPIQGMRQPIPLNQRTIFTQRPVDPWSAEEIGRDERVAAVEGLKERGKIGEEIAKNLKPIYQETLSPEEIANLRSAPGYEGEYDGADLYDDLERDRVYQEAREYAESGLRIDETTLNRTSDIEASLPTEVIDPTPEEIADIATLQSRLIFMIRRRAVKSKMLTVRGENMTADQLAVNRDVSGIKEVSETIVKMRDFLIKNGLENAELDSLIRREVVPAFGYEGPDRRYWTPMLLEYSPKDVVSSEGRYLNKRYLEIQPAPGDEKIAAVAQDLYQALVSMDAIARTSEISPISYEAYIAKSAAKAAEIGTAAADIGVEAPDIAESAVETGAIDGGIGRLTDSGSRLAEEMEKFVYDNVEDPRQRAVLVEMLRVGPESFIGFMGQEDLAESEMSMPAFPEEWAAANQSKGIKRGTGSDAENYLQSTWEAYVRKADYEETRETLANLIKKFSQDKIGDLVIPTSVKGKLKPTKDVPLLVRRAKAGLASLSEEDRRAAIEMALEANARHLAADLDGDGYVSIIRDVINMDKVISTVAEAFNENGQLIVDSKMFTDHRGIIRKPAKRGSGLREISNPELVQLIADTQYPVDADIMMEIIKTNNLTLVFDQDKGVIFVAKAQVDKRTGRIKKIDFDVRIKTRTGGPGGIMAVQKALEQYGAEETIEPFSDEFPDLGKARGLLMAKPAEEGRPSISARLGGDRPYYLDLTPGMLKKFATILGTDGSVLFRKDSIKERVLAYAVDIGFRVSQLQKIAKILKEAGVSMPYETEEITPEGQADKVIELAKAEKSDSPVRERVMGVTGPLGRMGRKIGEFEGETAIKSRQIRQIKDMYGRRIESLRASLSRFAKPDKDGKGGQEYKNILAKIELLQEEARQKVLDVMASKTVVDRMTPTGISALAREATAIEETQPFVEPMLDAAIESGQKVNLNTVPVGGGRNLPVPFRTMDEQRTNYTKDEIALFRRIRAIQRQGNMGKMTLGAGAAGIGLGLAANAITNRIQFGDQGDEITQANLAPAVALEAIGAVNNTAGAVANLGWVAMNRGDMLRALVNLFGSIGGGIIGGAAGALTGNPFVAGGGAFVGSNAGALATDTLYSAITGSDGTQQMAPNIAVQVPNNAQLTQPNAQFDKPQKDPFDIYGERT